MSSPPSCPNCPAEPGKTAAAAAAPVPVTAPLPDALWWSDPCHNVTTVPEGDGREVRRKMIQLTTAIVDHTLRHLMDDYVHEVLPEDFGFDVNYSFFPAVPTDNNFGKREMPIFFCDVLELMQWYVMLMEQVIRDQDYHHRRLVARFVTFQNQMKEAMCATVRTIELHGLEPNPPIQRSRAPRFFREPCDVAESHRRCWAVMRDCQLALRYAVKGMVYFEDKLKRKLPKFPSATANVGSSGGGGSSKIGEKGEEGPSSPPPQSSSGRRSATSLGAAGSVTKLQSAEMKSIAEAEEEEGGLRRLLVAKKKPSFFPLPSDPEHLSPGASRKASTSTAYRIVRRTSKTSSGESKQDGGE